MKKLLLSLGMMGLGFGAMSQVIFSVESPASVSGFYDFKGNDDGSSWGLASLSGVLVIDTIAIADDGTTGLNAQGNPASATGCNTFTAPQAANLTGKIAMVFRGDGTTPGIGACGFGLKAQNCQAAGAVAVIIVNREATTIAMSGGTEGATVTIPVIMVDLATGQAIQDAINNGDDVVGLIGDKTNYYADDVTIFDNSSVRANYGSLPVALAQSAAEFSVSPGTWVYNNGQNDQTGITVTAAITRNGTQVYTNTSSAASVVSGDSLYVTNGTYSSASYQVGYYEITYTVDMTATDLYAGDNVSKSHFNINDSLWSVSGLNQATGNLKADGFYRGSTVTSASTTFESCAVFKDAHASRIQMDGIYYGGVTLSDVDTVGGYNVNSAELGWTMYAWNDADKTTTNGTFASINQVASGFYVLPDPADPAFETTIFMPIQNATRYQMVDNQDYLLCFTTDNPLLYVGFSTTDHYDLAMNTDDLIRFPHRLDGGTWANAGFTGLPVPSIAMRTGTNLSVSENSTIESSAFPNPTQDVITVKVNATGDATLKITDMAGRVVSTQDVKINGGQFTTNVTGMNAGTYVFTLDLNNGTSSRFKVMVTK